MKKIKLKTFMCMGIIGMLFLTSCGSGRVDRENTLIYGSSDYTSINPALYEHGEINELLFAGLTAHDENNQVIPGLAEGWNWNDQTLTYTFKLREGLTFHDGSPLTSADVKFTLESICDEKNNSEIISNYNDIETIDCPDARTVNIKLRHVNVAFPDYMTIGILPKHILEGKDITTDEFNQNPIGAGPYKLIKWDKGQSITMERFKDYYGGSPMIKSVIFKIIPDTDARAVQLKAGDIDMAQVSPKAAEDFKQDKDYDVYQMDTSDYRAIAYNFNIKLFKENPELANILSYGIDRQSIVKSVLLNQGEIAYSPLQKNKYNDTAINKFDYDPDKCVNLLESEGWVKGKDGYFEKNGEKLSFTISAMADDQVRVDMAKLCANQLQKIGIDATAETKEILDWKNQDACIIGWGSPFDADDHTFKVFTTDGGDNYTAYSNREADDLLDKARHTENTEERSNYYSEFLNAMTKSMPYTFIAYVDADYIVSKRISGIRKNTVLGHHGVGIFRNIVEWEISK